MEHVLHIYNALYEYDLINYPLHIWLWFQSGVNPFDFVSFSGWTTKKNVGLLLFFCLMKETFFLYSQKLGFFQPAK